MKFRITEPVFFFGKQREPGEIMEAPMGPYRQVVEPGGLRNVAQFVEIPRELPRAAPVQGIKMVDETPPVPAIPATPPVAPPVAKPRAGLKLQGLAAKVGKLMHDAEFEAEKLDAKVEGVAAKLPDVFSKAHGSVDSLAKNVGDVETLITSLESVTNGAP